jgi:hypothetical protein
MTMPEERSIDFKLNEFGTKTMKYGLRNKLPFVKNSNNI